MQKNKLFPIAIIILLMTMLSIPVNAWIYPDCTSDAKFEMWGPRADKILIKLYAADPAEFAALKAGDIDICDWPLSKTEYDDMSQNYPNIKIVNYGCEFGLFLLDMNSNPNEWLDNPPRVGETGFENPVYPNPMADVWLRRAIGHLIDRPGIIADPSIGAGFGVPLYTTMPCPMLKYKLDVYGDEDMRWAWEYSPSKAEAMLDAHGYEIGTSGYREWYNPVTEQMEILKLIFYIRSDHPGRSHIGTVLMIEMQNVDLYAVSGENIHFATSGTTFERVMVAKDFHMYTGGWSLGVDPDHLILWGWDWYWHPGFCYNYGGHNDPEFNAASDGIMFSNTQEEAVYWSMLAQYRQAYMVLGIPLYAVSGNKAYSKTYVGAETPYAGNTWEGVVNIEGYGIDNSQTFMNMHPTGYAREISDEDGEPTNPGGPMTIRWGFKVPDIKQLNPVYSSWLFDWNVMDQLYDSLLTRNASDLGEFLPWTAKNFEVSTYEHPTYGTCSKIKFTLRPDISWSDGYALTVADVYFTFVELKQILESRGFPNPWWYSNVMNILSFTILDPCNFEVLLDVKSYWAVGWIGGNIILPKHIWKPIAETSDPQAFCPDPNMIGSSAWRFAEYVEDSHVLLLANRPGRTINTNQAGSEPITAINGFFRTYPLYIDVHPKHPDETDWWTQKIPPETIEATTVRLKTTLHNLIREDCGTIEMVVNKYVYIDGEPLIEDELVYLPSCVPHIEQFDIPLPVGKHVMEVKIHIKEPEIDSWGLYCTWINYTFPFWVTIKEDITGGVLEYYDGEPIHPISRAQIPTPDGIVDISDIARAARAFGAVPGHSRWDTAADITGDYLVDISDIAAIARKFGWP